MKLNATVFNPDALDKPILLVGPSLGGNVTHQWEHVAQLLRDDARVVFVDLPGTGVAPVWDDAVEPTLDNIAAGIAEVAQSALAEAPHDVPVYFAGLSISGATALHLARDYDKLFDGVAVVASAAQVGEPDRWLERAQLVEESGTQQLVDETTKRWFTPAFIAANPGVVDAVMEGVAVADDHSYAQLCRALATHDMRDDLSLLRIPVVLIAGERDSSTPIGNVEQVAESVLRGELHVVDGAAHQVTVAAPTEVADILRRLVTRGRISRVTSESVD
ncbi:MAG TPA: alpha/beta fold hydrolase [Tessaracoccus flavescens]|uniref:Alpha/beta fold hydrolase n=1 Tax=Tessaracoccus flavescens TaxID=399497 RepID=A0A921JRP3_9ACTN|nr:alpha/beta fold hydrolase [Tessaracoccus flavescens]